MLQNACLLAKIGADTAENEQHFAKILSKTGNYPTGRQVAAAYARDGDAKKASCSCLSNSLRAILSCDAVAEEGGQDGLRCCRMKPDQILSTITERVDSFQIGSNFAL